MSYILEALKRSQQERNRGEIPTLITGAAQPLGDYPPEGRSRVLALTLWILLLTAITLTAAYLVIIPRAGHENPMPTTSQVAPPGTPAAAPGAEPDKTRLGNPQPPTPTASTVSDSDSASATITVPDKSQSAATSPAQHPPPGEQRSLDTPPSSSIQEPASTEASGSTSLTATATATPAPPKPAQAEDPMRQMRQEFLEIKRQLSRQQPAAPSPKREGPLPQNNTRTNRTPPPSEQINGSGSTDQTSSLATLAGPAFELPLPVQNRLPRRTISVLAYSEEPGRRFIILNSRKMREGEQTDGGLTVESILKDGVLFRFDCHRFFDSMYR